jgi:hypothetical protein
MFLSSNVDIRGNVRENERQETEKKEEKCKECEVEEEQF